MVWDREAWCAAVHGVTWLGNQTTSTTTNKGASEPGDKSYKWCHSLAILVFLESCLKSLTFFCQVISLLFDFHGTLSKINLITLCLNSYLRNWSVISCLRILMINFLNANKSYLRASEIELKFMKIYLKDFTCVERFHFLN